MERDLSINLLEKPRLEKNRNFSYRYLFYGIIFAFLLPIYFKSFFTKKSEIKKSAAAAVTIAENSEREQIKAQWNFLLNFFNLLNSNLPETAKINSISGEQNKLILQGKINDNSSLNNFIDLLNKNLKNCRVSLNELNQKDGLEFSILITSKRDFSLSLEDTIPPSNAVIQHIIQNAERSLLQINSIKPEGNGLSWQLSGSYAAIMYFLSRLKKNDLVLDNFQIKPAQNQLEFDAQLKVARG